MKDLPSHFRSQLLAEYESRIFYFNLHARAKTKSPIEQMLMTAILCCQLDNISLDGPDDRFGYSFVMKPQQKVLKYTADFLFEIFLSDRLVHNLVVECDGHDFHERTAAQAQHDKKRDRAMSSAGYEVIRFTGSDIFRDAIKCSKEIVEHLYSRLHKIEEQERELGG